MPNPQAIGDNFHRFIVTMRPGFPRVRFHDLRHAHATALLLAGHATIAITPGVYGHVIRVCKRRLPPSSMRLFRRFDSGSVSKAAFI